MYDLLFVGAGPHCLTTLLRLLEPDSDNSIDTAQRKTTPKAQALKYWHKQRTDLKYRQTAGSWLRSHVAVIDPAGTWMQRWHQQFSGLHINYLRSSSAVHPDPLDTYALVTYAGSQGRMAETQPLNHIHKTQDFHGPFHTPGSALFEDFCADLIHRYCLQDMVTKDEVVSLTPVYAAADTPFCSSSSSNSSSSVPSKLQPTVEHWNVHLKSGQQLTARKVILGIGSTNRQRVPAALQQLQPMHASTAGSSTSSTACSKGQPLGAACIQDSAVDEGSSIEAAAAAAEDQLELCEGPEAAVAGAAAEPDWSSVYALEAQECSPINPRSSTSGSVAGSTISSSGWGSSDSSSPPSLASDSPASSSCGCDGCCDAPLQQDIQQQQQQQQQQQVVSTTSNQQPVAGTYPWGRLMHSWELVAAAAAPTAGSDDGTNSSSSSGGSCVAAGTEEQQQQLQQRGLLSPGERVLIIGGGLTSAHLAQLAVSQGAGATHCTPTTSSSSSSSSCDSGATEYNCSFGNDDDGTQQQQASCPVTLLMRGPWRVKQFDVDIPYMGRLRAKQLAEFRQLHSFDKRLALMKEVLQGGSMPPEAAECLQQLQRAGLLAVRQHSAVVAAEWDWQEGQWDVYLEDGAVLHCHRLWLATGSQVGVSEEPLLQSLLQQLPIPVVSGLPALQPSLEWSAGSGLYVLGAYAALQLGPGALNLAGAKTASVVMAKQLKPHLQLPYSSAGSGGSRGSRSKCCCSSSGNGKSAAANAGRCGETTSKLAETAAVNSPAEAVAAAAADVAAAAAAAGSVDAAPASFQPCTALKGTDTLCLPGVVSHKQIGKHSGGTYSNSNYGCGVQQQCCGSCWKSRHLLGRSRWGGGGASRR